MTNHMFVYSFSPRSLRSSVQNSYIIPEHDSNFRIQRVQNTKKNIWKKKKSRCSVKKKTPSNCPGRRLWVGSPDRCRSWLRPDLHWSTRRPWPLDPPDSSWTLPMTQAMVRSQKKLQFDIWLLFHEKNVAESDVYIESILMFEDGFRQKQRVAGYPSLPTGGIGRRWHRPWLERTWQCLKCLAFFQPRKKWFITAFIGKVWKKFLEWGKATQLSSWGAWSSTPKNAYVFSPAKTA